MRPTDDQSAESGREATDGPPAPVVPPIPPTGPPDPTPSVPAPEILEFGLRGADDGTMGSSEIGHRRLELQDIQLHRNPQGAFDLFVRLADGARSLGAHREADGTERDSMEVPASAALGVIQELLRARRNDGLRVTLRLLAARHLRQLDYDVVVVSVEAEDRGERIPLTGAAFAIEGVERASILATLQATNELFEGTLMADAGNGASPR